MVNYWHTCQGNSLSPLFIAMMIFLNSTEKYMTTTVQRWTRTNMLNLPRVLVTRKFCDHFCIQKRKKERKQNKEIGIFKMTHRLNQNLEWKGIRVYEKNILKCKISQGQTSSLLYSNYQHMYAQTRTLL